MSHKSLNVKVGDMLWANIKGADQNFGYGEVTFIWTDEDGNEWFDFYCEVNGGLRSAKVSEIINKPSSRMTSKWISARKSLATTLKEKGM